MVDKAFGKNRILAGNFNDDWWVGIADHQMVNDTRCLFQEQRVNFKSNSFGASLNAHPAQTG